MRHSSPHLTIAQSDDRRTTSIRTRPCLVERAVRHTDRASPGTDHVEIVRYGP
jgi:hypothetical protein